MPSAGYRARVFWQQFRNFFLSTECPQLPASYPLLVRIFPTGNPQRGQRQPANSAHRVARSWPLRSLPPDENGTRRGRTAALTSVAGTKRRPAPPPVKPVRIRAPDPVARALVLFCRAVARAGVLESFEVRGKYNQARNSRWRRAKQLTSRIREPSAESTKESARSEAEPFGDGTG